MELIKAEYILSPSLAWMYPMAQLGSHLHLCFGQPCFPALRDGLWVLSTPEPGSGVLSCSAPSSAFFSTVFQATINLDDAWCPPPYTSPFWAAKCSDGTSRGIVDVAAALRCWRHGGGAIWPRERLR